MSDLTRGHLPLAREFVFIRGERIGRVLCQLVAQRRRQGRSSSVERPRSLTPTSIPTCAATGLGVSSFKVSDWTCRERGVALEILEILSARGVRGSRRRRACRWPGAARPHRAGCRADSSNACDARAIVSDPACYRESHGNLESPWRSTPHSVKKQPASDGLFARTITHCWPRAARLLSLMKVALPCAPWTCGWDAVSWSSLNTSRGGIRGLRNLYARAKRGARRACACTSGRVELTVGFLCFRRAALRPPSDLSERWDAHTHTFT